MSSNEDQQDALQRRQRMGLWRGKLHRIPMSIVAFCEKHHVEHTVLSRYMNFQAVASWEWINNFERILDMELAEIEAQDKLLSEPIDGVKPKRKRRTKAEMQIARGIIPQYTVELEYISADGSVKKVYVEQVIKALKEYENSLTDPLLQTRGTVDRYKMTYGLMLLAYAKLQELNPQ